jgi:hypothetical protein
VDSLSVRACPGVIRHVTPFTTSMAEGGHDRDGALQIPYIARFELKEVSLGVESAGDW